MIRFDKLVEAVNTAAEIANATLVDSTDQVIDNFFDLDEEGKILRAKKITIEYPSPAAEGKIKMVNVDVPLITIVPISAAKVHEMRFTTELDIAIEKDELMVSFSKKTSAAGTTTASQAGTRLELVIRPQENTDGLDKLIEGYEKALRSQIPG